MSTKRYFDILGIPPTKNETLIKKAYRRKALKYHPDRNSSAAAKDIFIEVTEAYDQILLAIARGENPKESARRTTKTTTYRQTTTQQSTTRKKTASELKEERIKEAQKRYESMRRKEVQDKDEYFQSLTSGKVWKKFKIIMYACSFMSLLITLDMVIFPTQIQVSQIAKKNIHIAYSGSENNSTSPVKFENGQKAWISMSIIDLEQTNYIYLERTPFFKDIKFVKTWLNNEWVIYTPDYSLPSTFPLIPLILLIPLLAFFIKSKTFIFSFFYYTTMYAMPVFLFALLLSNYRWIHLLTFGVL